MAEAKSPVIEELQAFEMCIAKDQPEYLPLPSLVDQRDGRVMSRWELTDEERKQIAEGADVFVTIYALEGKITPMKVEIRRKDEPGRIVGADFGIPW